LLSCSSDDKIDDGEIDGPKHIALNYQASPEGQTGLAGKILCYHCRQAEFTCCIDSNSWQ